MELQQLETHLETLSNQPLNARFLRVIVNIDFHGNNYP